MRTTRQTDTWAALAGMLAVLLLCHGALAQPESDEAKTPPAKRDKDPAKRQATVHGGLVHFSAG